MRYSQILLGRIQYKLGIFSKLKLLLFFWCYAYSVNTCWQLTRKPGNSIPEVNRASSPTPKKIIVGEVAQHPKK